jgi:hypothetical protein
MKDLYEALIRERPTTLFEARERACKIEENLATSLIQGEENPKATLQINQIDDFVSLELSSDVRTYLQEEREKAVERATCLMINLLEEEREKTLEKAPRPPNEILELEKKQATELTEVKFSQYFQQNEV